MDLSLSGRTRSPLAGCWQEVHPWVTRMLGCAQLKGQSSPVGWPGLVQRQRGTEAQGREQSGGCCWAGRGGEARAISDQYACPPGEPGPPSLWGCPPGASPWRSHILLLSSQPHFLIPELSSPSSRFSQIFRARGASMPCDSLKTPAGSPTPGVTTSCCCLGRLYLPSSSTLEPAGGCGERAHLSFLKCPLHPHPGGTLAPSHGSVR